MHPSSIYEPELMKLWRERVRRFELSEMARRVRDRNKPIPDRERGHGTDELSKVVVDV
jgi:hypothetical protein